MKALLALLMLFSLTVFAREGGVTSGGGYTVICYYDEAQTQVKSIKLLDFYAAENDIADYKMLPLPEGKDVFEKAIKVIERIKHFSPDFVIDWKETIDEFKGGSLKFIKRGSITDIDDGATRVSPERNCFKRQAAVQVKNPAYLQHRLLIDKDIWDRMDEVTKVGLIVHEAIYRSAMEQGHSNAERVRYLTAMLFSTYVEQLGTDQWLKVFKTAKLDGCFNRIVNFNDHKTDEVLFSYTIGTEILSYDDETETGRICGQIDFLYNFLGEYARGTLFLTKGMKVSMETGGLCFEASRDPILKGMTLIYNEDIENFYDYACFSPRLVQGQRALRYSGQSTLDLNVIQSPLIELEDCTKQELDNSEITACEKLKGTLKLLGNTYPLRRFVKESDGERYSMDTISNFVFLFINGKRIRVRNDFKVTPDRRLIFEILNSKNQPQQASFFGKECLLGSRDRIVFDAEGSNPVVLSKEVESSGFCASLFN